MNRVNTYEISESGTGLFLVNGQDTTIIEGDTVKVLSLDGADLINWKVEKLSYGEIILTPIQGAENPLKFSEYKSLAFYLQDNKVEILSQKGEIKNTARVVEEGMSDTGSEVRGIIEIDRFSLPANGAASFTKEYTDSYTPLDGDKLRCSDIRYAVLNNGSRGEDREVQINIVIKKVYCNYAGIPESIDYREGEHFHKTCSLEEFQAKLRELSVHEIESPTSAKDVEVNYIEPNGDMNPIVGQDFLVEKQKELYIPREGDKLLTVMESGNDLVYRVSKIKNQESITIEVILNGKRKQKSVSEEELKIFVSQSNIRNISRNEIKRKLLEEQAPETQENDDENGGINVPRADIVELIRNRVGSLTSSSPEAQFPHSFFEQDNTPMSAEEITGHIFQEGDVIYGKISSMDKIFIRIIRSIDSDRTIDLEFMNNQGNTNKQRKSEEDLKRQILVEGAEEIYYIGQPKNLPLIQKTNVLRPENGIEFTDEEIDKLDLEAGDKIYSTNFEGNDIVRTITGIEGNIFKYHTIPENGGGDWSDAAHINRLKTMMKDEEKVMRIEKSTLNK